MGLIQKKDEKDEIDGIQIIERGEGPDGDEEEKIDLVAGTSAEHIALFLRNAVNRLRAVDHQFGRADKGVASLRGKDGRIPVLPPADQIRQDFRGSHGGGHPPLLKAGRHIDPRPFFAEQADIGDLVMPSRKSRINGHKKTTERAK